MEQSQPSPQVSSHGLKNPLLVNHNADLDLFNLILYMYVCVCMRVRCVMIIKRIN